MKPYSNFCTDKPIRDSGRFVSGVRYSPTTQIKPGERRSIRTEFKHGHPSHNKLPVGSVRERRETHTGLMRAWVKVAEPNVWKTRAVIVCESIHGPLPRGYVVHHKDRDSLNDNPLNLVALTRKDHQNEHRLDIALGHVASVLANFKHEFGYQEGAA
jgi:hypothetical protein